MWWNTRRFIDRRWPKCDGQVKSFSRFALFRLECGNCLQRNSKWLCSRVLKVLCLQLCFRNYVRSDIPRLGNTPASRRQLSLDSRIRLHYFISVSVINDSVETLNMNILDFFLVQQPVVEQGLLWHCGPPWTMASSFLRFLDHTQQRITVCDLDAWSARLRHLYLTTHNTHNKQTFMSPAGFEPTILAS